MKKLLFCWSGLLSILFSRCGKKEAASIGIIGGADGPTAIYITSKVNCWSIWGVVGIILVTITGIIVFIKSRK